MTQQFPRRAFAYRLDREDLVTIGTKQYRPAGHNEHGYWLEPIDGGPTIQVGADEFSNGLDTGYISVRARHALTNLQVPAVADTDGGLVSRLPESVLAMAEFRRQVIDALRQVIAKAQEESADPLKISRAWVKAHHAAVRDLMTEQASDEAGGTPRPYAGRKKETFELPAAKTLHNWYRRWCRLGFVGLVDGRQRRGNRNPRFTREETALLHACARGYMHTQRPSKLKVINDTREAFKQENTKRRLEGRPLLRVPSRPTIRAAIAKLPPFQVDLGRLGFDEAMRKWAPRNRGLDLTRPLQRVEIDEKFIDLSTKMAEYGLDPLLTDAERLELGLDGTKGRWWISVAIDCATRCILAVRLTRTPTEACAIATVDMITCDKGPWADAVGARSSWHMHGIPELIVTDGGSAYVGDRLNAVMADLGIVFERSPAANPMMRGTIERLFLTLGLRLMPQLSGRTFSDVVERGYHPSEERAALFADEFAHALIRWMVDCYHNEVHEALGCTPLQMWEKLYAVWQVRPKPSLSQRRAAFGTRMKRKITKSGIRVLGIRYQSATLIQWAKDNPERRVEIRWYHGDIGAIEVKLGKSWYSIPAVFERFRGMTAQHWLACLRAERLARAATIARNEAVIIDAYEAIAAINNTAMQRANVYDFDWTPARVLWAEDTLLIGVDVFQDPITAQRSPAEAQDQLFSSPIPVEIAHEFSPAESPAPAADEVDGAVGPADAGETGDDDDDGWSF